MFLADTAIPKTQNETPQKHKVKCVLRHRLSLGIRHDCTAGKVALRVRAGITGMLSHPLQLSARCL